MSGLDKIIGHISEESKAAADLLLNEAKQKADAFLADSEKKTADECDRIKKKAEDEVGNIKERALASAELKKKRILLSAKQELIDETVSKIKSELLNLSDSDYSEYFAKLFEKHIPDKDAVLRMSAKDMKRLPEEMLSGFVKKAAEKGAKLTLAEESANIENGFILDFGGVEENCSFSALIEQNSEEIRDIISKKLFA